MSACAKSGSPGAALKAPLACARERATDPSAPLEGREDRSAIIGIARSREEQIAGRGAVRRRMPVAEGEVAPVEGEFVAGSIGVSRLYPPPRRRGGEKRD
jgi:hypothetical protein